MNILTRVSETLRGANGKRMAGWAGAAAMIALGASAAHGATLVGYPDTASFLAAVGSNYSVENFDGFPNETNITTQVSGVTFSSSNSIYTSYFPIRAEHSPAAASVPNILRGGMVLLQPTRAQVMILDINPPVNAFSFELSGQDPPATPVTAVFLFDDQSVVTVLINDTDGIGITPEFFGVTADAQIVRVTLTGGFQTNGNFEEFGLDDLILGHIPTDTLPPLCSGLPELLQGDFPQVTATATDARTGDTGIFSVALDPLANNLALSVTPFTPGDPSADFVITQANPLFSASGSVVATDGTGKTCSLLSNFNNVPHGPVTDLPLCQGAGEFFSVSNGELNLKGVAACVMGLPGPDDPAYPPGYEPSAPADPFPCLVNTIQSPITGQTEMILKKDGAFEPRLRMLYSNMDSFGGFTPFTDVTLTVEQIATVVPDPTKIKGTSGWLVPPTPAPPSATSTGTTVKIVCAVLSETCNGLDDDGDGSVDEGIPPGGDLIDFDLDGYPLCTDGETPADCNDQLSAINPGAFELCNGQDDDCDGLIDEGNPNAGHSCSIAGLAGACSAGVTSCANGPLTCMQVVFSPGTPIVTILPPPPPTAGEPVAAIPFSAGVTIVDPDGDETHIVHEVVLLDGCPVFDGATYGDMDGLVTDEFMPLERGTLCRGLAACGQTTWNSPILRVEATDCAGNTGFAESTVIGSFHVEPTLCVEALNPASQPGDVGRSVRIVKMPDGRLRMSWDVAGNSDTYHVWSAANPFMNSPLLLANTTSVLMDLSGESAQNGSRYYLVRGVNPGGVEGP